MPDFFEAVESGDVALVSSMLKSGTQVNKRREALLSTWNGAALRPKLANEHTPGAGLQSSGARADDTIYVL